MSQMENAFATQWDGDADLEQARATILHAVHLPSGDASAVQLMLVLEVRLRGFAPYQTAISRVMPASAAAHLEAGGTLSIRVNPAAPTNIYLELPGIFFITPC